MALSAKYLEVQRVQAEYRARLLSDWQISAGARVLEVGCGQGDMTALLAQAVGPSGHVVAVDIAGRDYGSPLTLGQATDLLEASPVGPQIDFRFEFDVLTDRHAFADGEFDYVVLAHSSWYFGSLEQLAETLTTIRSWAKRLCFAEWDLEPRSVEQVPHMLAVLIQGQVEAFKVSSLANVRTPITRGRMRQLLAETGWVLVAEETIETGGLQDADWEIDACLRSSLKDGQDLVLPPKFIALLEGQIELVRQTALPSGNRALEAFSIVAMGSIRR